MNSEIKRPQCGGDFAGAQGPYRVPPAKAVKKERAVSSGDQVAIIIILSRKLKRIRLRESDLFPLPSPERRTVHFFARRYGRYYRSSLMSRIFLLFTDISLSLFSFFLYSSFRTFYTRGKKMSGTVRCRASMTIN